MRLCNLLMDEVLQETQRPERNNQVIRTYHEPDDRVKDHASGLKMSYRMILKNIGPMIEARRTTFGA